MSPTLRLSLVLSATALVLLAAGCNVNGRPPARRYADAGPSYGDAGPVTGPSCGPGFPDCAAGWLCVAVAGEPRCVRDPSVPPPPPLTCGDCPAPGECREGVCIQPSPDGAICEFDDECGDGLICMGAHCTPDPRTNACVHSVDCPLGLECLGSACAVPGGGCLLDTDCGGALVCEGATCVDRATCDIVDPDLAGTWQMSSELRLREALPDFLSGLLDVVEEPFRYLSGSGGCPSFGLPGWAAPILCGLLGPVRDSLPPWVQSLLGAIADLNVVLATWHVEERLTLTRTGGPDEYRGSRVWTRIRFMSRTRPIEVDPATIFDWTFAPDDFDAVASCGTLNVGRHELDVSIGALIAWLVDAVVYEATDGAYPDLESAARAATSGFCNALGDAAASSIDPTSGAIVRAACTSEVGGAIGDAVRAVTDARAEVSPITLRGSATIESGTHLRPGRWDGRLLGSDFTGDWEAWR